MPLMLQPVKYRAKSTRRESAMPQLHLSIREQWQLLAIEECLSYATEALNPKLADVRDLTMRQKVPAPRLTRSVAAEPEKAQKSCGAHP